MYLPSYHCPLALTVCAQLGPIPALNPGPYRSAGPTPFPSVTPLLLSYATALTVCTQLGPIPALKKHLPDHLAKLLSSNPASPGYILPWLRLVEQHQHAPGYIMTVGLAPQAPDDISQAGLTPTPFIHMYSCTHLVEQHQRALDYISRAGLTPMPFRPTHRSVLPWLRLAEQHQPALDHIAQAGSLVSWLVCQCSQVPQPGSTHTHVCARAHAHARAHTHTQSHT